MDGSKRILVVDDEAGIRTLLFDVLSGEGFHVTLARDGQESLDQMENQRFDLLITDLNMPRIDGMELLKIMKREGRSERVIVMTGNSSNWPINGADIPPVISQLNKPFNIPIFLEIVTSALTQAEA